MQKMIWFVVVLLVVVGLFVFGSRGEKKSSTSTNEVKDLSIETPANAVKMNTLDSKLTWAGKKTLIASWIDTGTISLKEGYVVLENGMPKSGEAIIDMSTISASTTGKGSGQDALTKHLSSDDFFNVAMYPSAKVSISNITPDTAPNTYKADGELTIRDVTNPVQFTFTMIDKNIKGEVSVDRTLYNVKFGSGKFFSDLGDNVIDDLFTVSFDLVLE